MAKSIFIEKVTIAHHHLIILTEMSTTVYQQVYKERSNGEGGHFCSYFGHVNVE